MARRQQQDGDDRLTHIVGNAGDDPTEYGERMRIPVGVTLSYGDDGETRWVSLWIKNPELQEFADAEISRGTKVVAVGFLNTSMYEGKKQYNLNVTELGVADMAKRAKNGSKPKRRAKVEEDDEPAESEELGW